MDAHGTLPNFQNGDILVHGLNLTHFLSELCEFTGVPFIEDNFLLLGQNILTVLREWQRAEISGQVPQPQNEMNCEEFLRNVGDKMKKRSKENFQCRCSEEFKTFGLLCSHLSKNTENYIPKQCNSCQHLIFFECEFKQHQRFKRSRQTNGTSISSACNGTEAEPVTDSSAKPSYESEVNVELQYGDLDTQFEENDIENEAQDMETEMEQEDVNLVMQFEEGDIKVAVQPLEDQIDQEEDDYLNTQSQERDDTDNMSVEALPPNNQTNNQDSDLTELIDLASDDDEHQQRPYDLMNDTDNTTENPKSQNSTLIEINDMGSDNEEDRQKDSLLCKDQTLSFCTQDSTGSSVPSNVKSSPPPLLDDLQHPNGNDTTTDHQSENAKSSGDTAAELNTHHRRPGPDYGQSYGCVMCSQVFTQLHQLRLHVLEQHPNSTGMEVKCGICGDKFGSSKTFHAHRAEHHQLLSNDGQKVQAIMPQSTIKVEAPSPQDKLMPPPDMSQEVPTKPVSNKTKGILRVRTAAKQRHRRETDNAEQPTGLTNGNRREKRKRTFTWKIREAMTRTTLNVTRVLRAEKPSDK